MNWKSPTSFFSERPYLGRYALRVENWFVRDSPAQLRAAKQAFKERVEGEQAELSNRRVNPNE
ncbi:hypothetical protein COMA2_30325 [Candidatus Nitrospira nitrificans]|uniref:Uncharacterized protein n=1 Tax=Candidatus Nitrospira nitrificans TaxID=1742973 RepID=A0A0S4LLZ5_9BACT|nr:hypothetical protein COMA2_30325 [Candidatus Nitrospira nitrificans]